MPAIEASFEYMACFQEILSNDDENVQDLQQTLLEDVCHEKDKAPVEVDVLFDDQCLDIEGVRYTMGSELLSCCDCFRFVRDPLFRL